MSADIFDRIIPAFGPSFEEAKPWAGVFLRRAMGAEKLGIEVNRAAVEMVRDSQGKTFLFLNANTQTPILLDHRDYAGLTAMLDLLIETADVKAAEHVIDLCRRLRARLIGISAEDADALR